MPYLTPQVSLHSSVILSALAMADPLPSIEGPSKSPHGAESCPPLTFLSSTSTTIQSSVPTTKTIEPDNIDVHDSSPRTVHSSSDCSSRQRATSVPSDPPYHVFSLFKKRQMVLIVSIGAMFSPLTSNIYFPALDDVADVRLNRSRLHLSV